MERRRRAALPSFLLLLGALSACNRGAVTDPPEQPLGPNERERPMTTVRLLDAGRSPRRPLRFRPRIGAAQTFELTAKRARGPTLRLRLEAKVLEVTPDLDVRYDLTLIRAEERRDDAVWEVVPPLPGHTRANDRGWIRASQQSGYPTKPRTLLPENALRQWEIDLGPALPTEPVGVGARWEVTKKVQKTTYEAQQTAIYTLTALEDHGGSLRIEGSQQATRQVRALAGLWGNEPRQFVSMRGKVRAEVAFDLGLPLATGKTAVSTEEDFEEEAVENSPAPPRKEHQEDALETEVATSPR